MWSREPLLRSCDLRAGHHITTLGTDEPGKQELDAESLSNNMLVVDDRTLADAMGATANAGLQLGAIDATVSEIFLGEHPGRSCDEQCTIYAPVGLPWQDLALSWFLMQSAPAHDVGASSDLLA